MTQAFKDMMYLFSCGALGIKPEIDHEIDFLETYKKAQNQGVWYITFLGLKGLEDKVPIDQINQQNKVLAGIASNIKLIYGIHKILKIFISKNIKYCILKGEILSSLYKNPYSRISSDTDILINENDINFATQILRDQGFHINPLANNSNHIVADHPDLGRIELHTKLYYGLYDDVWFGNKALLQEEYIYIKTDDGMLLPTLGHTDGLIFVTLHLIKHFIGGGADVRRVMDLLLYMKTYKAVIEWNRYNNLLEQLKYQYFIYNLIGIGIEYLNFCREDFPYSTYDNNIIDKILYDIEIGGIYGRNEKNRYSLTYQFTKEKFYQFRDENHEEYMKSWVKPTYFKKILSNKKDLAINFPYVRKTQFLYPVAWFHRIIRFGISVVKKDKNVMSYINPAEHFNENEVTKRRMDLIRELDMI